MPHAVAQFDRQYMETDGVRLLTYSTRERGEEFSEVPTAYELGYTDVDNLLQFRAYFTVPVCRKMSWMCWIRQWIRPFPILNTKNISATTI
jgi:hypothetical protein